MKNLIPTAEERIKEAARKVFLEKGFDATTTRDIAREAGLNSALMNYYFRSKEKLFVSVFEDMLRLLFEGMVDILNKPISLKEKITALIDHDFQLFSKNSHLSLFVHNELHREPDRFLKALPTMRMFDHSVFEQQLEQAIREGEIQPIDIRHVLMLIACNVQFIFHNKIMTTSIWQMEEEAFEQFAENHRKIVTEVIVDYLFTPRRLAG